MGGGGGVGRGFKFQSSIWVGTIVGTLFVSAVITIVILYSPIHNQEITDDDHYSYITNIYEMVIMLLILVSDGAGVILLFLFGRIKRGGMWDMSCPECSLEGEILRSNEYETRLRRRSLPSSTGFY